MRRHAGVYISSVVWFILRYFQYLNLSNVEMKAGIPAKFEPSTSRIQWCIHPFAELSIEPHHNGCSLVYALPEIYLFLLCYLHSGLSIKPPSLRFHPPTRVLEVSACSCQSSLYNVLNAKLKAQTSVLKFLRFFFSFCLLPYPSLFWMTFRRYVSEQALPSE
jgi:hypothetical protein